MKCSNCGNEFNGNGKFCPVCGQVLGTDNGGYNLNNQANVRQQSLGKLGNLYSYFSEKSEAYSRYTDLGNYLQKPPYKISVFAIIAAAIGGIQLVSFVPGAIGYFFQVNYLQIQRVL